MPEQGNAIVKVLKRLYQHPHASSWHECFTSCSMSESCHFLIVPIVEDDIAKLRTSFCEIFSDVLLIKNVELQQQLKVKSKIITSSPKATQWGHTEASDARKGNSTNDSAMVRLRRRSCRSSAVARRRGLRLLSSANSALSCSHWFGCFPVNNQMAGVLQCIN